jgi:hypothetical protein
MSSTKIHLLINTPLGTLIVYKENLWHFRVLANNSIYGKSKEYYTAQLAEDAGREWVGYWQPGASK